MPFLEYRGVQYGIAAGAVLGRGSTCTILLCDTKASRRHPRVWLQGDKAMAQDLNSSNGTLLNGKRLPSDHVSQLSDGDLLIIGADVVRYAEGPMGEPEGMRSTLHVPMSALKPHQPPLPAGSGETSTARPVEDDRLIR